MHISIADDLKKQFHAACAIRGLKMSQVVAELIEQWLKANNAPASGGESMTTDKATQ
ncbi:plasmid partition protein ParG [Scytonema hofmannii]|uniref:plasmid partition protein ParG n=1 Tax=Scytonema hofmannii TaxID=34078 RepID=UPI000347B4C8|nr:plasmid partition protein ParG [Scytonema hofmannii]